MEGSNQWKPSFRVCLILEMGVYSLFSADGGEAAIEELHTHVHSPGSLVSLCVSLDSINYRDATGN